jgi:predicted transcriptional regulator
MAKQLISANLRKFIKEQIQTAPKLEVLLLLHREQGRSFAVAEVASELGFEGDDAKDQLTSLEAIGLVKSNRQKAKFRYHPVNAALASMVDSLAIAYPKQRVPILSAILAEEPHKVRRFVEAFRLARSND